MNKILITLLSIVYLNGCAKPQTEQQYVDKYINTSTVCIDNVSYISLSNGITVQYKSDGSIKTC